MGLRRTTQPKGGNKMKIYVVIDNETCTNVAIEVSWFKAMEKAWLQDVYFLSEEDFFKKYQARYTIEEWEV